MNLKTLLIDVAAIAGLVAILQTTIPISQPHVPSGELITGVIGVLVFSICVGKLHRDNFAVMSGVFLFAFALLTICIALRSSFF